MSFVSLEVWPMGLTKEEKKMVAINTNIASLLAQNNTRQVNNELEKAMERLSSGLRINSAGDDATGLAISYNPIPIEAFSEPTEQIIIFLAEIEAGENAVELLENFTYFRLYFEALNVPRKLKTVFGNIEDPVKQPLEPKENTLKALRAYIFGLRSNTVPTRPAGWLLEKDENIPKLAELVAKPVTILDIL